MVEIAVLNMPFRNPDRVFNKPCMGIE